MGDKHEIIIDSGDPYETHIFIDGEELTGVISASWSISAGELSVLKLEMYADDITFVGHAKVDYEERLV